MWCMIVFVCTVGTGCYEFSSTVSTFNFTFMNYPVICIPVFYLVKGSATLLNNTFEIISVLASSDPMYINIEFRYRAWFGHDNSLLWRISLLCFIQRGASGEHVYLLIILQWPTSGLSHLTMSMLRWHQYCIYVFWVPCKLQLGWIDSSPLCIWIWVNPLEVCG